MKYRFLSGNALKIIAAISMFLDHAGLLLFPTVAFFRIVGRVSMPIFAFLIAEGCRYTRDKFRHFILIAALGAAYSAVYYFVYGYLYFSIFTTFTFSILLIYALQNFKKSVFCGDGAVLCVLNGAIFVFPVAFLYALNRVTSFGNVRFLLDYGFWGCMLPVFAALCDGKGTAKPNGGGVSMIFICGMRSFPSVLLSCACGLHRFCRKHIFRLSRSFFCFFTTKNGANII